MGAALTRMFHVDTGGDESLTVVGFRRDWEVRKCELVYQKFLGMFFIKESREIDDSWKET